MSQSASWSTGPPALSTTLPHGGNSRRRGAGRGTPGRPAWWMELAGWEGALLLHTVHLLLVSAMSFDMPGQNSEVWARAVIPLVPWWAAWRALRHVCRNCAGMTMRSPLQMTPLTDDRSWIKGK